MDEQRTLIGIDGASNKTGVAVARNGKIIFYNLIDCHRTKDREDRITEMTKSIVDVLEKFSPDVIYMEDTWVSQNPKASQILTTILGGVRYWSTEHNCIFRTILPSSWRKQLGMNEHGAKRNELKQRSIDYVKDKFGIDVTDDISDAICITIVGYNKEFRGNED